MREPDTFKTPLTDPPQASLEPPFESSQSEPAHFVELFGPGHPMPLDVQIAIESANPNIPEQSPVVAANSGVAFDMEPIDHNRIAELLAYCKGIGFVVQWMRVSRRTCEYSMVYLKFGQIADPRIGEQG